MEQVFFVVNGDITEVNKVLASGGRVKSITATQQPLVAYGYAGGESSMYGEDAKAGNVFAYIVVELDAPDDSSIVWKKSDITGAPVENSIICKKCGAVYSITRKGEKCFKCGGYLV